MGSGRGQFLSGRISFRNGRGATSGVVAPVVAPARLFGVLARSLGIRGGGGGNPRVQVKVKGNNFSPSSGDRVSQCACSPVRDPPNGVTRLWAQQPLSRRDSCATSRGLVASRVVSGLRSSKPSPRLGATIICARGRGRTRASKRPAHAQEPNVYLAPKCLR